MRTGIIFLQDELPIVLITALDIIKKIVVHLKKGRCGKFAKAIFYFPCSVAYSSAWAKVTGKRFNFGDGEGMQVPCKLSLSG